jgi:hypothetical protein
MYRVSGISIKVAGFALLLGVGPSWAGPPNNDVSDLNADRAANSAS